MNRKKWRVRRVCGRAIANLDYMWHTAPPLQTRRIYPDYAWHHFATWADAMRHIERIESRWPKRRAAR